MMSPFGKSVEAAAARAAFAHVAKHIAPILLHYGGDRHINNVEVAAYPALCDEVEVEEEEEDEDEDEDGKDGKDGEDGEEDDDDNDGVKGCLDVRHLRALFGFAKSADANVMMTLPVVQGKELLKKALHAGATPDGGVWHTYTEESLLGVDVAQLLHTSAIAASEASGRNTSFPLLLGATLGYDVDATHNSMEPKGYVKAAALGALFMRLARLRGLLYKEGVLSTVHHGKPALLLLGPSQKPHLASAQQKSLVFLEDFARFIAMHKTVTRDSAARATASMLISTVIGCEALLSDFFFFFCGRFTFFFFCWVVAAVVVAGGGGRDDATSAGSCWRTGIRA
jgi:hypothetical protein